MRHSLGMCHNEFCWWHRPLSFPLPPNCRGNNEGVLFAHRSNVMANAHLGILAVLIQISSVNALSWAEASSTAWATQDSSSNLASASASQTPALATPAPYFNNGNVSYEPSHICGWVDFSSCESIQHLIPLIPHSLLTASKQGIHTPAAAKIPVSGTRISSS